MSRATRIVLPVVLLLLVVSGAALAAWFYWTDLWSPPLAGTPEEAKVLRVLEQISEEGRKRAGVPIEDGRALRLLAEATAARNAVEIGTSTGYSGLWLCLALLKTGGKLTTFELDPGRAALAREHFRMAGVDHLVTVIEGDAHQKLSLLEEPIDLVFIDADKEGYVDYLNQVLPLLRPGGLILAHNVSMAAFASGYVKAVSSDPRLETVFYQAGNGLGITMKKR